MAVKVIKGLAFPFRISVKGQALTSKADETEDTHIQESIVQILLTSKGERRMEPDFGSEIRSLIFQENDPSLDNIAIAFAQEALQRWEPRVNIVDITLKRERENVYLIISYQKLDSLDIVSFITPTLGGEFIG